MTFGLQIALTSQTRAGMLRPNMSEEHSSFEAAFVESESILKFALILVECWGQTVRIEDVRERVCAGATQ